jgi:hypothetical protein
LARAGESICELLQVYALPQRPPKYTTVQSRLGPQLAFPNSRWRATRRWLPATLLAYQRRHARCAPQFPGIAEHSREFTAQSSLPSQCNFTEDMLPICRCKPVKTVRERFFRVSLTALSTIGVENWEERERYQSRHRDILSSEDGKSEGERANRNRK